MLSKSMPNSHGFAFVARAMDDPGAFDLKQQLPCDDQLLNTMQSFITIFVCEL